MPNLFTRVTEEEIAPEPSVKLNVPGLDLSKMANEDGGFTFKLNAVQEEPKKKKKSSTRKTVASTGVITETEGGQRDEMLSTNIPYATKYQETTDVLKYSIGQVDGLLNDVIADSAAIRSSRALKRKYDLLSLLSSNASSLIGNKIAAAREINNTISKCNEFELKRMKELNLANSAENSDKKIMDAYNAFISMPVGDMGMGPMGPGSMPSLQQVSHAMAMGNTITATVDDANDPGYQNYLANMNPAQRLSMYEKDPNIKQVIVYNQQDGSRYFEVMNMATGEVVPGVDKHDAMFLEDVTLDLENKIARNINIGETYPIVIVGEPVMNMY